MVHRVIHERGQSWKGTNHMSAICDYEKLYDIVILWKVFFVNLCVFTCAKSALIFIWQWHLHYQFLNIFTSIVMGIRSFARVNGFLAWRIFLLLWILAMLKDNAWAFCYTMHGREDLYKIFETLPYTGILSPRKKKRNIRFTDLGKLPWTKCWWIYRWLSYTFASIVKEL